MIDLFPFAELPVGVLGLGREGRATARALARSGATLRAWDDDERHRAAARAESIAVLDDAALDWREPVSLAVEHRFAHISAPHPWVAAARAAGCEVICDAELLARSQRDAGYLAVVSRNAESAALDLLEHVFQVSGRDSEVGGDPRRPLLLLPPLELGGVYAIAMPPGRAALTVSITFDCALLLDLGATPWPPFDSMENTVAASRWVFHRQTAPRTAVVSIDDPQCAAVLRDLRARGEQRVVPVSGRAETPGGVFVVADTLVDDLEGKRIAVTELPLGGDPVRGLLAAAAYAGAAAMNVPRHAAMACLRSYYAL